MRIKRNNHDQLLAAALVRAAGGADLARLAQKLSKLSPIQLPAPEANMASDRDRPVQPVSGTVMPRYAGPSTFARLPELRDVARCDVAILGVPFDAGTSYRPGARFGPQAIRQASRHLRTQFHPSYGTEPFVEQQVADAGDVACNPFNIAEAVEQIQTAATDLLGHVGAIVGMGGDHTIALPLLRAVNHHVGPVALVHFDAHLDTWDTYFGAPHTHGTVFRRAGEEGLFLDHASMHVGIRGPLYSRDDIERDEDLHSAPRQDGAMLIASFTMEPGSGPAPASRNVSRLCSRRNDRERRGVLGRR